MSDFQFQIAGDATQANRAADSVLDRLADIRKKAEEASKGMSFDKLSTGFARLGDALRQEQAALARTTDLHKQLVAADQPLVQSFNGLAAALKREQEMLEQIQGPMKRYQSDLQALDGLLRRGAITQQQHAQETEKARAAMARSQQAPQQSGLGSTLGSLKGGLAVAGIGAGVSEIGAMANEFQNLQNRLRYLAGGDMAKVNAMFGELQGVAARTRADLGSTTEAFVRISLATKQMGLSSSESLRLTESLNKAIALSGATGAEASAGMIQLSQGLASGALRGDELRSVMEQLPAVADVIAQSMGVSRGELRKMGEDGKITAQVIVDAFKKAGSSIDKDFGNTVPTISQSFTTFKNEMLVMVGKFDQAFGVSKKFGEMLSSLAGIAKEIVGPLTSVGSALSFVGDALEFINPLTQVRKLGDLVGAWDTATSSIVRAIEVEEKYAARRGAYVQALMQGADAVRRWHNEQVEFNIRMVVGAEAADAFRKSLQGVDSTTRTAMETLAKGQRMLLADEERKKRQKEIDREIADARQDETEATKKATQAAEKYNHVLKEYEKIGRALLGTETSNAVDRALRAGAAERAANAAADQKVAQDEIDAENRAVQNAVEAADAKIKAHDEWVAAVQKGETEAAEARRKAAAEEAESMKKTKEAIASGAGSIAADLFNMANEGELSLERLGASFAKLALQIAAMQIGGPWGAFLGSFAGGLSLPGHATGGQFMVGGTGGTDSNLVAFRASRDERVTIETPDDVRSGRFGGAGGGGDTIINLQNDERDIVAGMGTRAGRTQFVKLNRQLGKRR